MAMYDKPPQKDPNAYSRSKSRHQPFQPQNNNSWQQPAQSYPQQQGGTSVQYQQAKPYPQQGMNSQYQAQPYPQQGMNSYQQGQPSSQQSMNSHQYPSQPYPQQSQSYQYQQSQAYPQQNAQPYQQPPYHNPNSHSTFKGKFPQNNPKFQNLRRKFSLLKWKDLCQKRKSQSINLPVGKKPAKIVDAAEFFGDKPVKSRGELGVTIVDNMSDEQLAAQLAQMKYGGRKKSRRSMKAATELEADYSNIPADMLPSDS